MTTRAGETGAELGLVSNDIQEDTRTGKEPEVSGMQSWGW
jgi:hypothetical protein